MIVALTGASGHIGSNLIRELLTLGHEVKVLLHKDNRSFEGLDITMIKGTIHQREALVKLFEGSEIVFHLAALISIGNNRLDELIRVNVDGTKYVIECCKLAKVKRLVHFSSIHALDGGKHCSKLDESSPLNLDSRIPYERSKAISEQLALEEAQKNGLELIVVNPTAVIGPWDFGPSYLGQFFIRLYKGEIPALLHGGYNWVDARDVSRGAIAAALKGASGERYILSGTWANLKTIVGMWSDVTARKMLLPLLPSPLFFTLLVFTGNNQIGWPAIVFVILWLVHYANRIFIFPQLIHTKGKKMPLLIVVLGIFFNCMNAGINGYWIGYISPVYMPDWLLDPRFILGILVFISGFIITNGIARLSRIILPTGKLYFPGYCKYENLSGFDRREHLTVFERETGQQSEGANGRWRETSHEISIPNFQSLVFLHSFIFHSSFLSAQAPKEFSYQAVARNGTAVLDNASIDVKFEILQGGAQGTMVWNETHSNVTTNSFGLFSLKVGSVTTFTVDS